MKRRVVTGSCYSVIIGLLISIVMPTYAQIQWFSQLRQSASTVVNKVNAGLSGLLDKSGKFADSLATQSYQKIDQWIDTNWELIEQAVPLIQKELRKESLAPYEEQIVGKFKKNALPIVATMVALAALALKEVAKEKKEATTSWFARVRQKLTAGWQSTSEVFKRGISGIRESLGRAKNVTVSLLTQSPARIVQWIGKEWQLVSQAVPLLKRKIKKESLSPKEERILASFRNRAIGIVVVTVALAVTAATVYYLKKSDKPLPPEEVPIPPRLIPVPEEVRAIPQEVALPQPAQEIVLQRGEVVPGEVPIVREPAAKQREVEKMIQELEQLSQDGREQRGKARQQTEERQERLRRAIEKQQEIEKWLEKSEQKLPPPPPPVRGGAGLAVPAEPSLSSVAAIQKRGAELKKIEKQEKQEKPVEKLQIPQEGTIAEALGALAAASKAREIEIEEIEIVFPDDLRAEKIKVLGEYEQEIADPAPRSARAATTKRREAQQKRDKNLRKIRQEVEKRLEKKVDEKIKELAEKISRYTEENRETEIEDLEIQKELLEDQRDQLKEDKKEGKIEQLTYQKLSQRIVEPINRLEDQIDELKDKKAVKRKAKEQAEWDRSKITKELKQSGAY